MSQAGRRRRTKIAGQFVWRLVEMLECPAYRVLSLSAHRVMARLEIEFASHGGTENGRLPVTFNQFMDYGIDRHSIAPAIRELQALGFIEVTEPGRAGNAEFRAPNLFRLTYRHTDKGNSTDEWRRIASLEEAQERVRMARNPRRTPTPRKQKSGGGKRTVSVGNSLTENATPPVGETHTTVPVGETHTTSIFGVGNRNITTGQRGGQRQRSPA